MTKDDAIKAIEEIPLEWARKGSDAKFNMITIEQAVNAIRALPDAGWRDISEAPKDGTYVLIASERFDGGMGVAMFDVDWWYLDDGKNFEIALRGPAPTHFMPLPQPPEKA